MRPRTLIILAILNLLVLRSPAAAVTPAGFVDELVATVAAPTALAFTPDGRMLITTQPGRLRVVQGGTLLATPALDLSSVLCTNVERGLLGVAIDRAFSTNGFIYLYYTFNRFGSCAQNASVSPVNRVSRFTLTSTNTVSRTSELVLIDNIPSPNGNHNGGDLHVASDGFLYVSVGDGGCDYLGNSGCAGANDAARDQHVLLGKILRITTSGAIPTTNPFRGTDSVRCNTTGRANAGQKCQETFASGLRNPFRIAFDPNASTARFFINDVGQNVWEEVNEGRAGADYGWNVREGHCANGSTTNCGAPPTGLVNPIYDYAHTDGCASITGGAFVPRGLWPAAYDNAYLFSDYVCGAIFRLTPNADGTYTRTTFASGLGNSSAVAMRFGPAGSSQGLYYTTYASGGQVRRISMSANRSPVPTASATPSAGAVPLAVTLNAGGSSDPDGDALTFSWNFGDGSSTGTGAVVTHTYSVRGRYTATVTVRDGRGGQATASVTIDAGNGVPAPAITAPSSTALFAVGQTVTLTGSATDPEDGALAATRLSWSVILHHNTHTHPFFGPATGNNLTFQAPGPEDLAATTTSYLEIVLTATDSLGASTTIRRNLKPRLVNVSFDTVPSGLTLTVNGTTITTPRVITSWDKYRLTIGAATQKDGGGGAWLFSSWSNGGPASQTVVTPATATSLTATFSAATVQTAAADTYVRSGAYASQNFGTATTLVVKESSAVDYRRRSYLRFTLPVATAGRAVLRLYGSWPGPADVPVAVYPVTSTTWAETAMTWNTQPSSGTALSTVRIGTGPARWIEWDVTAYVQSQIAAGRSAVAFMLGAAAATESFVSFASGEAANGPELLITGASHPTSTGDIVLYTSDVTAWSGTWRAVADSSAAGGLRMWNPNANLAKVSTPLAAPANYVELTFTAERGRPYRLWMRGKAEGNSYENDSVHVQFSGSVTSTQAPVYRIGTAAATSYVLEDCTNCAISGWGWQDNGYGAGVLGPLLYFETTGPQRMRIQVREDGLSIDQIVLSPATFINQAPGALTNDATILPKP